MGLTLPYAAYAVTIIIELVVGIMFVFRLFTRLAALILAVWCISKALTAHYNFADRNMLINFHKNVALHGGFVYAALLGAGAYSLDAILSARGSNGRTST
ncbi:DoxX family protein [Methylobacterium indicum]|uniref:DoxX family protein n=1 Tax=Methylobacterium indicum TaxID=1775910 RepID=UPI003CC7E4F8